MTEYMVNIWGGAWNADANPSIEKDLGIKEGAHYFETEKELNAFIRLVSRPKYKNQGMVIDKHIGNLTHKATVFVGTFKHKDKEFVIRHRFVNEYPPESAVNWFIYGNGGCDCNRSRFIREQYGDDAIPELDCGWQIELVDYHVEYEE